MGFTYDVAKTQTEALHWVRLRIGATKPNRSLVEDEEIVALLITRGLTATSDPIANSAGVHMAAADMCRTIAAGLAYDSEIALTEVGPVKSNAAETFRTLARDIESEVSVVSTLVYPNPEPYDITHVVGVDTDPEEE